MEAERCLFKVAAFGDGERGGGGERTDPHAADKAGLLLLFISLRLKTGSFSSAETFFPWRFLGGRMEIFAAHSACQSQLSVVDFSPDRSKSGLWTRPLV